MHNDIKHVQIRSRATGVHCGWIPESKIDAYLGRHTNMIRGVTMIRRPEYRVAQPAHPAHAQRAADLLATISTGAL